MLRHLYCIILFLIISISAEEWPGISAPMKVDDLIFAKGKDALGLKSGSSISQDQLQKVLSGAANNNKDHLYSLGLLRLYGITLARNEEQAIESFKKAADLGHLESITAYAVALLNGIGVQSDFNEALVWLRKAVSLGDINAIFYLGTMLLEGKGFDEPNYVAAASYLSQAANAHMAPAEHLLAVMYEYGLGFDQNFDKAIEYYRKASDQGYLESMYHLGVIYAWGRGVDQDFPRAYSLFDAAARENHAPSSYMMGVFRLQGYMSSPPKPDYAQALNWFERASSLGDHRISEMAANAATELSELLTEAEQKNNAVYEMYVDAGDRFD